jgi:hypothetical protein
MDGAHTHGDGKKGLGLFGLVTAVGFGGYMALHTKAKDAVDTPAPAVAPTPRTVTVVEHASVWPTVFVTSGAVLGLVAIVGAIVWAIRRRRASYMGTQSPLRAVTGGRRPAGLQPAARKAMEGDRVQAQVLQGEPIRTQRVSR